MKFEVKGLEEFSEKLKEAIRRYPDKAEEKLEDIAKRFKKSVQEKTPVKTGKLKKSYKLSKVQQIGRTMFIEFRSTAPHFHLIERGHFQKTKHGDRWIPGDRMVEKTVEEFEEIIPREVNKWLEDIFKELR
ncbi:HK97 gp10 family phage protein [Caldanaerobacter subterraneus]|uniref:HK97 gp10 family phage protein n=1 Tax=Caldanaerobacter subterraneus TaxID=911092 RepID=A0A7Y2PLJ3_9THEO|nr:HK97 gp10 family phage protein [Caldanaerobacter subterraneus]NNG67341.1 HK97 gp10 family phage protein [Caldanaerobacter subterraneus]